MYDRFFNQNTGFIFQNSICCKSDPLNGRFTAVLQPEAAPAMGREPGGRGMKLPPSRNATAALHPPPGTTAECAGLLLPLLDGEVGKASVLGEMVLMQALAGELRYPASANASTPEAADTSPKLKPVPAPTPTPGADVPIVHFTSAGCDA